MRKGIINVVIFYSIGLGLTILTYWIFGAGLGHGPGIYFAIPFLIFIAGLLWTFFTIYNYYVEGKTEKRKGIIWSNSIVVSIFLATILYSGSQNKLNDIKEFKKDDLVNSQSGDTTSISYNGILIYQKVKDSIHVDKRDSLFSEENK
jgi:hypothetical protein